MGAYPSTHLPAFLWFYLFVPGILGFKCVGNKCDCVEELKVVHVDCSRAGLKSMPQAKETLLNYSTLLLRFNAFVEVNFSVLEELFPNLTKVDLRGNPLDCERLADKRVLKVIMITDCEITASVKTRTMRMTRKTLKTRKLTHPTTTTSILPSSHSGTSMIIYMTVVISGNRFINAGHYPLFKRCREIV